MTNQFLRIKLAVSGHSIDEVIQMEEMPLIPDFHEDFENDKICKRAKDVHAVSHSTSQSDGLLKRAGMKHRLKEALKDW